MSEEPVVRGLRSSAMLPSEGMRIEVSGRVGAASEGPSTGTGVEEANRDGVGGGCRALSVAR